MHVVNVLKNSVRVALARRSVNYGGLTERKVRLLVDKSDPIILDIGCNDGAHTLWFLKLFDCARVYCFEPDPRAVKRFKDRVNDKRAQLFEIALSDVDGERDFHMSDGQAPGDTHFAEGWDLSGSLRPPKNACKLFPWLEFRRTTRVQSMRLDTWCNEHGIARIDFLWADVQGAEVDLIKGATNALRFTRYLYTEYSDKEQYAGQIGLRQMEKLLTDFEIVEVYPNDVLFKNRRLG